MLILHLNISDLALEVSQKDYSNSQTIDQIPITCQKQMFLLFSDLEEHKMRSMIGQINWFATQT